MCVNNFCLSCKIFSQEGEREREIEVWDIYERFECVVKFYFKKYDVKKNLIKICWDKIKIKIIFNIIMFRINL